MSETTSPRCRDPRDDEDEAADLTALDLYCKEVGQYDLLSRAEACEAAEEIARLDLAVWRAILASPLAHRSEGASLGKTAQRLRQADIERDMLRCGLALLRAKVQPTDSPSWETYRRRVLIREARAERARHAFLTANLRLVVAIAARCQGRGLPLEDLIQEGNLGLMKALHRWDPRRGYAFATFASWWVRACILRAIKDHKQDVRVPCHLQEVQGALGQKRRDVALGLGHWPSNEELADEIGVSLKQLDRMRMPNGTVSLTLPVAQSPRGEELLLQDTLSADLPPPINGISTGRWEQGVLSLLDKLSPMERKILMRRFGLGGHEAVTLAEIGKLLGLSRERIRQVEKQALLKLGQRVPNSWRWT